MFDFFKPGKKYMLWFSATEFWIAEFIEFCGVWGYTAKFRRGGQQITTVVALVRLIAVEEIG